MEIKKLLTDLCSLMSVVGYEYHDGDKLTEIVSPYFDEHEHDNVGNHIFVKRCGKADAKRLFIDVHYDEVGLMVKGITDGGHLRVCALGGLDSRILPASEVVVYGKETMPGIVLMKSAVTMNMRDKDKDRLTPVSELLIDVGLTKEEAMELVPIGTPIGFEPVYTELRGGYIAGKGMDDKCCAVPVLAAISVLDMKALDCDIYFSLSAREEVGHRAVSAAAFRIRPDAAIVLDVTFGLAPEGRKPDDIDMKGGPSIALSALLDKDFTDFVIETAKKAEIPYQPVVDAVRTGTHADELVYAAGGIPTVLLSVPVWFMHTANETVAIDGLKYTAKLMAAVIREKFGRKDG